MAMVLGCLRRHGVSSCTPEGNRRDEGTADDWRLWGAEEGAPHVTYGVRTVFVSSCVPVRTVRGGVRSMWRVSAHGERCDVRRAMPTPPKKNWKSWEFGVSNVFLHNMVWHECCIELELILEGSEIAQK